MRLFEAERASRSATARATYFGGGSVAPGGVARPIWQSWQRCQAAGHEPSRSMEFDTIGRSRIAEIEERSRALIAAAREEMQHVASVVSQSKMVALLSNELGAIVHIAGDLGSLGPRMRLAARKGVDLGEGVAGTNAVGTALVERSLVSVVAQEHYIEFNAELPALPLPYSRPADRWWGPSTFPVTATIGDRTVSSSSKPPHMRSRTTCSVGCGTSWLWASVPCGVSRHTLGGPACLRCRRPAGCGQPPSDGVARVGRQRDPVCSSRRFSNSTRFVDALGRANCSDQRTICNRPPACVLPPGSSRPASGYLPAYPGHTRGSYRRTITASVRESLDLGVSAGRDRRRGYCTGVRKSQTGCRADVPALLVGETGTGKELVARSLHYLSNRSEQPFVAVNCAAFPEFLVEFDVPATPKGRSPALVVGGVAGKVELANGGTLFLDEIGDMPVSLQSRLLRVLQERSVVRLGENRERPVNFALICATHCDLPDLIRQRLFREDLLYRINGLSVVLPPLRDRQIFRRSLIFSWNVAGAMPVDRRFRSRPAIFCYGIDGQVICANSITSSRWRRRSFRSIRSPLRPAIFRTTLWLNRPKRIARLLVSTARARYPGSGRDRPDRTNDPGFRRKRFRRGTCAKNFSQHHLQQVEATLATSTAATRGLARKTAPPQSSMRCSRSPSPRRARLSVADRQRSVAKTTCRSDALDGAAPSAWAASP